MSNPRERAAEILQQIQDNKWNWLKVKRFVPEAYGTLETRYAGLERHHAEETTRMVEVIEELCRAIAAEAAADDIAE